MDEMTGAQVVRSDFNTVDINQDALPPQLRDNPSEPVYDPVVGKAIVDRAIRWVGIGTYVYGGFDYGVFDCSSFVSYALTGRIDYARWTTDNLDNDNSALFQTVSVPRPGDIVIDTTHVIGGHLREHCGIYVSPGVMVHAGNPGETVSFGYIDEYYRYRRYVGGGGQ